MKRTRADAEAGNRTISRRAAVLGGLQLAFVGGLAARMNFLQVDQADQFRLLAEDNRIKDSLIPPARGEVFDRNGVQLAKNVPSYRIVVKREDIGDVDEALERLSRVVKLDPDDRRKRVVGRHQPGQRQRPRPARCHPRSGPEPDLPAGIELCPCAGLCRSCQRL